MIRNMGRGAAGLEAARAWRSRSHMLVWRVAATACACMDMPYKNGTIWVQSDVQATCKQHACDDARRGEARSQEKKRSRGHAASLSSHCSRPRQEVPDARSRTSLSRQGARRLYP